MAKSGITVSSDLERIFHQFGESKADFLQVGLANEAFQLVGAPHSAASPADAFRAMQEKVSRNEPTYFIFRVPGEQRLFVIVFHCPDASKVKDRMLFASSIAALRKGFGDSKFINPDTFRTSNKEELDFQAFTRSREEVDHRDLMTSEELYRKEAEKDSVGNVSSEKVGAIVQASSSLKVSKGVGAAVSAFSAGSASSIVFRLNPESEELEEVERGNFTLDDIAKKMDKKEPRYALVKFTYDNDGKRESPNLFVYYCPDSAKPKLKMFYSSAKAMVIQYLADASIEVAKKLEASDPAEVSVQSAMDELHPKVAAKAGFAKPKSQASKSGSKRPVTKFNSGD